jgi:hypothetical protein
MAKLMRYRGMTAEQLAEATKEYDEPNPYPKPVRVHPKVAAAERRIRGEIRKRGPGRPKVGQGAKRVLISIEGGLLKEADKLRGQHMSRSDMVALGLRLAMGLEMVTGLRAEALAGMTVKQVRDRLKESAKKGRRKSA